MCQPNYVVKCELEEDIAYFLDSLYQVDRVTENMSLLDNRL